ncbi:MAG: 4-(cytidine 5'-diphospho)-2-C-methyl-D-erythritol kinase [Spirochaetes bacterium]|nr:4-(cytidine 5'-diphospho)-2-C-methyl-D-erythritol kinase [Spirochaetota bacterium]
MGREIHVTAPAKVNLHLEILAKRQDGYHDLLSLFQAISLADTIRLRAHGPDRAIRIEGAFDIPARENLIAKAVELFRSVTGLTGGVEAAVEKRIPAGGGFGGGSSDAAATLRGLQALFDRRLPSERLRAMAAALGSDVPFFLETAAAVVEGRGERVLAVQPRTDFAIVALIPPVAVDTALAFKWLGEQPKGASGAAPKGASGAAEKPQPGRGMSREQLIRMYAESPVTSWRFSNSFDEPVFARHPSIAALRDRLLEAGAVAARLTGSGSTVIGIFHDRDGAQAAVRTLGTSGHAGLPDGARAVVLFPLASLPAVW